MKRAFARVAQIIGAWGFLTILSFVYDSVMYPLAIGFFGAKGALVMALGSLVICFVLLVKYEKSGTDWLGVNVAEEIKSKGEEKVKKFETWFRIYKCKSLTFTLFSPLIWVVSYPATRVFLIVLWALKKNDVTAFIVLNIVQDPFVATVFLRHGRFDGLRKKDWLIFFGSVVFSNAYWILRNTILVYVIKAGWYNFSI